VNVDALFMVLVVSLDVISVVFAVCLCAIAMYCILAILFLYYIKVYSGAK
jgi:hypothetical protein